MTNQYHILTDEAPLDLIETDAGDQEPAPMLYAGGSDGGVYPKSPQDFDPHLHLMLMSAYWRQIETRPEQASSIADTVQESSTTDYSPEAWLEYRKR